MSEPSEHEKTPDRGAAEGADASASPPKKKRILLVEDEPLTRLILLNKLRIAGFSVDVAWNGYLALEKLRNSPPDAIFLDLMLPDIKGVDVIREARQDPKFGDRPIYVCTSATLMSVWARRAAKAGATRVYNKVSTPIDAIVTEVAADLMVPVRTAPPVATPEADPGHSLPQAVRENVAGLAQHVHQLSQCDTHTARADKCGELRARVHSLANDMAKAGRNSFAREATALESFLKELGEKPKHITESSLRTVSTAVEVMDALASVPDAETESQPREFTAVVVGDDLVSRTAISNALRNTGFKPVTFSKPAQARDHLAANPADVVVVDLSTAEKGALELCKRVHEHAGRSKTPIVYVGNSRDLKKPSRTLAAGTSETIVKPFLSMELALKALGLVLKNRLPGKSSAAPTTPPVAPAPSALPASEAAVASAPAAQSDVLETPLAVLPEVSADSSVRTPQAGPSAEPAAISPSSSLNASFAPSLSIDSIVQTPIFQKAPAQPGGDPPPAGGSEPASIEINEAAKIVSADVACAALLGWESAELIGQDLAILLKSGMNNDLGHFLHRSNAAAHGAERPTFPVTARRKNGSEFPATVKVEPRLDGSQFFWTLTFRRAERQAMASSYPSVVVDGTATPAQSAALAEALARLQQSQATLQSANEELQKQFQAVSAEAATQREALEKNEKLREEMAGRVYTAEVELNRARTGLERETEERKRLEQQMQAVSEARAELESKLANQFQSSEELVTTSRQLREQRDEATAAADRAEGARKEEAARAQKFEEELIALRRAHDELAAKLTTEQQAASEARARHEGLESRLRDSASELERVSAELTKATAERERAESEMREQLRTAKAAAEKAEAAWMEEAERAGRLEKEVAELRRSRDEDRTRQSGQHEEARQAAAEAKRRADELEGRLRESAAELERFKAELQNQSTSRGGLEAELRSQLEAANESAAKVEAAFKEEAGRCIRLEAEIASLQRTHEELNGKFTAEQRTAAEAKQRHEEIEARLRESTAELERVKAELENHTSERGGLVSDLRGQLDAAKAAADENAGRQRQVEQEAESLRKAQVNLKNQLAAEQEAGAKAKRRIKELEKSLRESASGFATTRAELQKRLAEHERAEQQLRGELETIKSAQTDDTARYTRLEGELTALRELHEELNSQWKAEQQTVSELKRQNEDVEQRLRETAAELGRAKATIENHAAERARLESDQQHVAGTQETLGNELCQLRESEAGYKAELGELERRIRDGVAALARATADLEKERGERRRIEQRAAALAAQLQELHSELRQHLESEKEIRARVAELEQQLRERDDMVARVNADLNKESAERQLAEEQLRAAGDMSAQLRKYLSLFEESKKAFKRTQEDLESRLQANAASSGEQEARLQKEIAERQRVEEALAVAQRNLAEQSQKNALELAKLQSALQVEEFERKRLEGDAVQARFASLDSARVGRTLVNSLRREIRQPVETLLQNTRRLLEVELKDEQKKLVESVLENALLVQSSLQETTTLNLGSSGRPGVEGSSESAGSRSSAPAAESTAGKLQP